jgi:hypothetical protein
MYIILALWLTGPAVPLLDPSLPAIPTIEQCNRAIVKWDRYFDKRMTYPPTLTCEEI